LYPTVEGLQLVNESMSKNLDSYETPKLGYFERLSSFFVTRATLKHAIIIGLIFSLGFVPALCVFHFGSGSIDTAILTFATVFGPSIAVYLNYALKKEK